MHDHYEGDNPRVELSQTTRNLMIILFVFSLIFFFLQYRKVYPRDPTSDRNDF